MKRRVVFRADASKTTGYGHFVRCLALAGYLKDDFRCEFASFNQDDPWGEMTDYQLGELVKVCTPLAIVGHSREEFDGNFMEDVREGDIVVLDNYYYDTIYQQALIDKGCKLVCIDDMHKHHMVCDLLLTPCPLTREDFSLEPYTRFAGGVEWAFLRDPFLSPVRIRNIQSEIKRVVLTMGGSDAFNLTDKMTEVTKSVLPAAVIDVICGEGVRLGTKGEPNVNFHHRLSAEEMVALFDKADVGIFSASTVCIEAFSRSLPVIAGYYVDNQEEFYNYGVRHKYFSGLGCLLDEGAVIAERLRLIIKSNRPVPMVVDFKSQKEKIIELFKALY